MEIKINKVKHVYNEFTPFAKTAIEDISIKLKDNGIIGIVGKTGSGKTTLVETLNALIIPSYGNVEVVGFNIRKGMNQGNVNDLRRKVGLVFQSPEEQFFNPTVREEVSFALKYFKYKNDRIKKQVSRALVMVGLDDSFLERKLYTLSGGEKRKVAIASVMVFNPKVIILDEPTVGLDYKSKKKFMQLIKTLKEKYEKTVIVVSHDIDMLDVVADQIVVIDDGKLVLSGPKDEVFSNIEIFNQIGIRLPRIVEFTGKVMKEKGIKLGRYTDIKDLIKDIYRHV